MRFWDKADSIYKKAGLVLGFLVIAPTILAMLSGMVASIVIIWNIESYVNRFEEAMDHTLSTQGVLIDAFKAETDRAVIEGMLVHKTNAGDIWIFRSVDVNGKIRKTIFSGHYRKSEHNIGYFDFKQEHHWIRK